MQPAVKVTICWAKFITYESCQFTQLSSCGQQLPVTATFCWVNRVLHSEKKQKRAIYFKLNCFMSLLSVLFGLVVFLSGLLPRFEDIALCLALFL